MRIVVILFLVGTLYACTNDETPQPTVLDCDTIDEVSFKTNIQPIIETSCSYNSSCHGDGAFSVVLKSYDALKPYLESELLRDRVLVNKNMPPIYATEGPTELTVNQLGLIDCWLKNGFLNN